MKRFLLSAVLNSLLLTACSLAPADSESLASHTDLAARTLYDLGGLDALKEYFNENAGRTRLILLLSPT